MLPWVEARDYLRQGLAIRRTVWSYTTRIKMVDGRLRIFRSGSETDHGYYYPYAQDTNATDWMIYE